MSIAILAVMFKFCNNGGHCRKYLDSELPLMAYLKELLDWVIHRICGKPC